MKSFKCPICRGAGEQVILQQRHTCSACGGKGWVQVQVGFHPEVCPVCGGSGDIVIKNNNFQSCHGCDGKGWIQVRDKKRRKEMSTFFDKLDPGDFDE